MTAMWEARAAEGRIDELVVFVLAHADPAADVYRSGDDRVVVIDPTGAAVSGVPDDLVSRPPHVWSFRKLARQMLRP